MQKKLHSRRLDYDAKLAKVQKAKKEKPEWEEEMQAAKAKYEDTRECVLGIMSAISESQVKKEKEEKENAITKGFHDCQSSRFFTLGKLSNGSLDGDPIRRNPVYLFFFPFPHLFSSYDMHLRRMITLLA
jgi:hypothetical protein